MGSAVPDVRINTTCDTVLLHRHADACLVEALGRSTHVPTTQSSLSTQEEALGSSHVEHGRVLAEVHIGNLLTDVCTLVGSVGKDTLAHAVVLTIAGSHKVNRDARILITVEVGIHRSTHAVLVPLISLLPDGIDGCGIRQSVILSTTISLVNEANGTCRRFLCLGLSQSGVSIDHAQCQSQTQGVGQLGPLQDIATIDGVVVAEDVVACEGIRGEHLDSAVEFFEELGIDLVEGIVALADGTQCVVNVRNRPIVVGNTMHGEHLHHISKGSHLRLILLQCLGMHLGPSRHDLHHAHFEHSVAPFVAFREVVGAVVATASPTGRVANVARIAVGADTNLMLVGTRRSKLIILVAANLHHRRAVDHLREEGTHGLAVLLHVSIGGSVLVGVQALEVVGASRRERESEETK